MSTEGRNHYVYTISDRGGAVLYVGAGRGRRWLDSWKRSHIEQLRTLVASGEALPAVKVREGLTQAEAHEHEVALIKLYGRLYDGTGTLFNLSTGGASGAAGVQKSAEHAAKIAESVRKSHAARRVAGLPAISEATRERMRQGHAARSARHAAKTAVRANAKWLRRKADLAAYEAYDAYEGTLTGLLAWNRKAGAYCAAIQFEMEHRVSWAT